MALHDTNPDTPREGLIVYRLLIEWRHRCAARHVPWPAQADAAAEPLCSAIVDTLEQAAVAPDLVRNLHRWHDGAASDSDPPAALQCLGEAVVEVAATEYGGRPRSLDPVLRLLAAGSSTAPRHVVPLDRDLETGCPNRRALEGDVALEVLRARTAEDDVAVLVFELEDDGAGTGDAISHEWVQGRRLMALLGAITEACGNRHALYRVGRVSFAVVATGREVAAMGELALLVTCSPAPRFAWGRSSLRTVGDAARLAPDLLLFVAEADMQFRRRDLLRAQRSEGRRRHLSMVGAVAAGAMLLAGAGSTFGDLSSAPPISHAAAPAAHVPAATPPASGGPGAPPVTGIPTSAVAPPPAPPPRVSTVTPAPTVHAVLASYQTPVPTTPAPAPVPTTPAPAPVTAPAHGHSAQAPGHLKKA